MSFYILGLPRCKTVWLSHVLNCQHAYYSQYRKEFTVSSVDTNPVLIPTIPVFKIFRPIEEIVTSCLTAFDTPTGCTDPGLFYYGMGRVYIDAWDAVEAPVVTFAELNDIETMRSIAELLKVPVSMDRFMSTRIMTMNRDIETPLRMTAASRGIPYEQLIKEIEQYV